MKTAAITEQELKGFGPIEVETETDQLLELTFSEKTGNFAVWLNGKIMDTKKTFKGILLSVEVLNCKHCLGI